MPPKKSKTHGRGRKASDASSVSEAPSLQSQQSGATAASKRTKRNLRSTTEQEHEILQGVQEVIEEEEEDELAGHSQTSHSSNRHVRFGTMANATDDKTTATHATPHPRKMGVKRRATASPSADGDDAPPPTKYKRVSFRRSLPTSLSQDQSEQTYREETEFRPLKEVLKRRMQRRARTYELQLELETAKQQKAKKRVQQIEEELAQLQEQDAPADNGDLDDDMLVLTDQVLYPQLPQDQDMADDAEGETVEQLSLSQSQARSQEAATAAERKKFQDAVLSLSRAANEAKTKLQILDIEVQGLGFADEGADTHTVLLHVRDAFVHVRETLYSVLPDTTEDVSNEEMVEILTSTLKDFANRLKTAHKDLEDKDNLGAELGRQIRGLIEHLAERDLRIKQLEERWTEVDKANEEKAREIEHLQDELQDVINERDSVEDELSAKTKEADALAQENDEFETSVERLKASLQRYQDEEKRLTELIDTMQANYDTTLSKMNKEREETVGELNDRLDEQMQSREEAEQLSKERQSMITGLELQIEKKGEEMDGLQEQVTELTAQFEAAEAEIEEKDERVEDLETRVDRLDEELAALRNELEELRSLNESERAQNEAAASEIDELKAKLLDQGKQLNELRQKLFEVQQKHEKRIQELEQLASERDEEYQSDIAREVARREASDQLAQERLTTIDEYEARIKEMETSTTERDERTADLEDEISEKVGTIESLQDDLQAAEDRHNDALAQKAQKQEQLNATIDAVKATLAERESQIAQLRDDAIVTADLHNGEIEDRNARVAELNHAVAQLQDQVAQLEKDKLGLEKRVETEAYQMLQLQNEKDDEIEALKETIRDKQAKILTVEHKAHEADNSWQAVLDARDSEIATLRETEDEMHQTVETLTSQLDANRSRFRNYVLRTSQRRKQLLAQLGAMNQTVLDGGKDEDAVLQELDDMEEGTFTNVPTTQTLQTKKTRGRKKRVVDSGIGMANGNDDESMIAM